MLANVIADWVASHRLERQLDAPLRALLRAEGFHDIEFTHGASEFGRDFIAKRRAEDGVLRQYSLQSKVGDIGLGEWRDVRQQLEDIRTVALDHPMYDPALPGVIVLVTNGRLKGDARKGAAGYGDSLPDDWQFELWSGERLITLLGVHLEAALGERAQGALLSLLGGIDEGLIDASAVERHSRRWVPAEGTSVQPVDVLEAALVANRTANAHRADLACVACLGVLRAHLAANADKRPLPPGSAAEIAAAGGFYASHAEALWESCGEATLQPETLIHAHQEFGFWVTYPVRCVRLVEHLALLALWRRRQGQDADDIAEWLSRFIEHQPGAAHPISDRFAVALLAPAVLLHDREGVVASWLTDIVRWTADRHDGKSLGLAGIDAEPAAEIDYLLGDLEHVQRPRRRESLIAGAVLEIASLLGRDDLIDLAENEFAAVRVVPTLRRPPDGRPAWLRDGEGVRQHLVSLGDPIRQAAGSAAPWAVDEGMAWEALATWTLLADRWDRRVLDALSSVAAERDE